VRKLWKRAAERITRRKPMARTWNSGQCSYLTERTGVVYEGERNNCLEACRHRSADELVSGWVPSSAGMSSLGRIVGYDGEVKKILCIA
jgi:hypothetical protein